MNQSATVLPNLFVPGAAKSGTSTLHKYLSLHSDICMTPNKEPCIFWRSDKTLTDYRVLFSACADRKYRGESSVSYMVLPEVAYKIKSLVRSPRFIFILRNPIDRAWSHYWSGQKEIYGKGKCEFREAFLQDISTEPSVSLFREGNAKHYYHMGMYGKWLQLYFDTFEKHDVLVLDFDEFTSDTSNTLNVVFNFLDVPKLDGIVPIQANPTRILHARGAVTFHAKLTGSIGNGLRKIIPDKLFLKLLTLNRQFSSLLISFLSGEAPPKISLEQRKWLAEFYSEDVQILRQLTGLTFESWKKDFPLGADRKTSM